MSLRPRASADQIKPSNRPDFARSLRSYSVFCRRLATLFVAVWAGFLSVWAGSAYGQEAGVIERIRVSGVERVEPATVKAYLNVEVGQRFSAIDADAVLQKLYDTNLFKDIELLRENNTLIVKVAENPIVNQVAFEGNDAIDDKTLKKEVSLAARDVFRRSVVRDDVSRLRTIYRRRGRFNAVIEPEIIKRDQNRVDLVYTIDEGPATKVRGIHFVGNKQYSDGRLRRTIRTTEARWWKFLARGDGYDPDRLAVDEQLLKRFYRRQGYAEVDVTSRVAELAPNNKSFFVSFSIDEGKRYRFGNIGVESAVPGIEAASLQDQVTIDRGDWFTPKALRATADAMNAALESRGRAFVEIRPEAQPNPETGRIDVTFRVAEGQRAIVQRVDISGNTRTADRVIRRQMELAEGDPFNRQRLRQSERALRNLGYFGQIKIDVVEGEGPGQVIIKVDVTEKSTGKLSLGAGFSTGAGPTLQASISEKNLGGRGQNINLTANLSARRAQLEFGFTEPYFLGRDLAAGFDVFRRRDRPVAGTYSQQELGGEVHLAYPLGRNLRQRIAYRLQETRTAADDDASPSIQAQEGTTVTSSVSQSTTLDKRDNRFQPSTGYLLSLSNELAGLGGTRRYLRTETTYEKYFRLHRSGWVLELSGASGYIDGLNQDVRIDERFRLGADRVRGFASSGIGPRDLGDPNEYALGGQAYTAGTTQIHIPAPVAKDQLRLRTFADAGTLTQVDASGQGIVDRGSIRISTGVGLTWRSPIGPITLDWGWPVKKEPYDRSQRLRFSFGAR